MRLMKKKAGLWIDFKKAVIFILTDEGASIKRIRRNRAIRSVLTAGLKRNRQKEQR